MKPISSKNWTFSKFIQYLFFSFLAGIIGMQFGFIVQIFLFNFSNPPQSNFMINERLRLCDNYFTCDKIQHQWVGYDDISKRIKQAVIASEDANFNEHSGIETKAMMRAWEKNQRSKRQIVGGSTITQQLAKNLFLSSERTYERKLQELLIAFYLETLLDKHRIFEIYLNTVEWGEGVFGIEAAAQHYFNKEASQLKSLEAARLASALPAPKCFDDEAYCANVSLNFNKKARIILKRMAAAEIPIEVDDGHDALESFLKKSKD